MYFQEYIQENVIPKKTVFVTPYASSSHFGYELMVAIITQATQEECVCEKT